MAKVKRTREAGPALDQWLLPIGVGALIALDLIAWIPWRLTLALTGQGGTPAGPIAWLGNIFNAKIIYPPLAKIGFTLLLSLTIAAAWLAYEYTKGARAGALSSTKKTPIDTKATLLGVGHEIASTSKDTTREVATKLGVSQTLTPGQLIGKTIAGQKEVWGNFEDVTVDIWGPRTGKTTSRAIPLIIEAPGVVVATSNKRDIVDIPRRYRTTHAGPVWVFDPQNLANEPQTWFWNPLTFITHAPTWMQAVRANELADIFVTCSHDTNAKTDAHFHGAAQELLAGLLLAAATANLPLIQVSLWLDNPNNRAPIDILTTTGHTTMASAIAGKYDTPDKQRAGYIQTAKGFCGFMINEAAMAWVTPTPDAREFNPDTFVRSTLSTECVNTIEAGCAETLFLLSKEGAGSATALVTALTVAITRAAEAYAEECGGRLPVPLTVVLDEAANVCKWSQLPDMYSHYGSRGICVDTILQSWSQGVAVWGKEGMNKLWSAATKKIYGGGVSEVGFLRDLADLTGKFWTAHVSTTSSTGGTSRSRQVSQEAIFEPAELASFPRERILVLGSGFTPILARPIPYWQRPWGEELAALNNREH